MEYSFANGDGRKALITGISGNIGVALGNHLLAMPNEKWYTHGVSRNAESYLAQDNRVYLEPLDLNRSWDYLRLWCKNLPRYDIVAMAHGIQKPATLEAMSESDWINIMCGNLSSCIGLTQALVKEDRIADGALIVYCSSIQANTPRSGRGLYAASKAGLEAFSKTVAVELATKGIRSIALRLGQLTETMGGIEFSEDEKRKLGKRSLLPWVNPNDVAMFIENLYWQKSMTGCVIDLDSGHGRNCW